MRSCLPDRLAALGYDRVALHGMIGYLFSRHSWYKTIGFQEIRFHDKFKQEGLPDCMGAFVGTCDADIASWIGRRLGQSNSRPTFVYWMTLNSHLPVPVPAQLSSPAPCQASFSVDPGTPLCSWFQLVVNVHRSVSQLALRDLARPTVFVIVGDHAPPFGNLAIRDRFSQTDVPYVILLPRSDRAAWRALEADNRPASGSRAAKQSRPANKSGGL
ncbi:MAG: sulfatase-like hydrolase/transferase [Terracidiphilus sp.]